MENQENQNINTSTPVSENLQTQTPQTPAGQSPLGGATPVSQSPKPKFSLAALIGIILFLLIASAAGYFAFKPQIEKLVSRPTPTPKVAVQVSPTPTSDSTANWKTYTNKKLSFQIKIPLSYKEIKETEDSVTMAEDKLGSGGIFIRSKITNYSSLKSCEDVYKDIAKNPSQRPDCLKTEIQNVKLDGVNAVRYSVESTGVGGFDDIIQTTIDPKIEISTRYAKKEIFDQILSTFELTESDTGTDTSNWKTYKNSTKNFSFNYPANWELKDNTVSELEPSVRLKNKGTLFTIYFERVEGLDTVKTIKEEKIPVGDKEILFQHYTTTVTAEQALHSNLKETGLPFYAINIYLDEKKDLEIIKNILATFKFNLKLPPGGSYSTEGLSCGPNAGPAGDVQCAPGLVCTYKNQQEKTTGIGTCVKE